jgi:ATP-binding cassette subfamily C protein
MTYSNSGISIAKKYQESLSQFNSQIRDQVLTAGRLDNFDPKNACEISLGVCLSTIYIDLIGKAPKSAPKTTLRGHELISRFCQENGLQWRRVSLEGKWYHHNSGPILGFTQETFYPCSLIWTKRYRKGCYVASSLKLDNPIALGANTNIRFASYGYCFYPTLREQTLRLQQLWPLITRAGGSSFALTLTISACIALVGLLPSFLLAQIVGEAIPNASMTLLLQYTSLLGAALISSNLLNLVRNQIFLKLETRLALHISSSLWDRLLQLPIPHLNRFTASELTQRSEGILSAQNVLSGQSAITVIDGLLAISNIALMIHYSPILSLISLAACISLVAVSLIVIRLSIAKLFERSELGSKILGLTQGLLGSIDTLRVTAAEVNGIREWAKLYSQQQWLDQRIAQYSEFSLITGRSVGSGLSLAILMFATIVINRPGITSGIPVANLLGFNAALGIFLGSILQLTAVLASQNQQVKFLWNRLQPVLDHPLESNDSALILDHSPTQIIIRDVKFGYPSSERLVIDRLSLNINDGEHVALVGRSGSGKTTLVRLMLGFERDYSGFIGFDDFDLKRLNLAALRRNIGIVLQDIELLSGTIADNVAVGRSMPDEAIWAALSKAAMAEQVNAMPLKLNTPVISGGGNLSGGERQRLMLARALAQQPSILIMDEATSALDNRAQAVVERAIGLLQCTRITIAHRLSTIRQADRIVMLDSGRVVEEGEFEKLVSNRGAFFNLVESQLEFEES